MLFRSNQEIIDKVIDNHISQNSLFLSWRYKNKPIKDIPFIQTMDIRIINPNEIRIVVYEKALAGYVEYLGKYMYFDKDGIIVESSDKRTYTIPQVTGLDFGFIILYQKLPVENEEIFQQILYITQLLTKYDIQPDKLHFDSRYDMTISFGTCKVMLGSNQLLDEKIMRLKHMLPDIQDKNGTLRLDNYSEDTKLISFELEE